MDVLTIVGCGVMGLGELRGSGGLTRLELNGGKHRFRRPPTDLVDSDSDTNCVLSGTSSSDYLDIESTPRRFSAGRESQYRGRPTAARNRAGWGEIARRSTR